MIRHAYFGLHKFNEELTGPEYAEKFSDIAKETGIEFLLNNTNVPAAARAAMGGNIPQYSATMATVLVVIGPIMVVYPFFQKYFVRGLTVGSVKG